MNSKRTDELFPLFSLILAATLWGLLWYPLRLLADAGLVGVWTTLIAYGSVFLVAMPSLWRNRAEYRRDYIPLFAIAMASGWCNIAFILAMLDGTVVRVLLLFYLSPLWTVLLGWLILGERMSSQAIALLGLAMLGAMMMLWVPELGLPWPQSESDWMAISSGLAFSLSNVLVRREQQISISSKVTAAWWGAALIAAVWLIISQDGWPQVESGVIIWAIILGVIGLGLATIAVQYGVTHMPVHRSAVILLFELIIGAVSAGLLTDEVVRPIEWLGGSLIILAAWLTARQHKQSCV